MALTAQGKLLCGNYFYTFLLYKSCPTALEKAPFPLYDGCTPTEMNVSRVTFLCATLRSIHELEIA